MRQIGSQMRETLEEAGVTLVARHGRQIIVDESADSSGDLKLYVENDHFAGHVYEVYGVGYEFVRSLADGEDAESVFSDELIDPVKTEHSGGKQLDYYDVDVPDDLYNTQEERDDYALDLAREQASDWRVPALWTLLSRSEPNALGETTYRICRTSNEDRVFPIPAKVRA